MIRICSPFLLAAALAFTPALAAAQQGKTPPAQSARKNCADCGRVEQHPRRGAIRLEDDLGIPIVGVSLLYRKGYFRQRLDGSGNQKEEPEEWRPEDHLELMRPVASIHVEGRAVQVRSWRFLVRGVSGRSVPVYLLDTDFPGNTPWDRTLTDSLYGGDNRYRLCQEVVLGVAGAKILPLLGHGQIGSYHMNEGHSALLALFLLEERMGARGIAAATSEDLEAVRRSTNTVFVSTEVVLAVSLGRTRI